MLFAVRHANRETPGLRAWAYSYLCGLLLSFAYLVRPYLPEGLSVIATQALTFAWAWLNLAAARAYTGRRPWSLAYPAWALVIVLGLSLYWTWWLPELKLRIILVCVTNGTLLLLSATTMLTADIRRQPERYLFTLACGGQGLLRLANALILGQTDLPDPERLGVITQVVLFESIVALVMHVFGVLMLANGHITAELRHFAERDPLTSVFNRRTFLILLDKSVNLMRRMNSPLSLLALDLDHFKRINDTWGHGGGDQALRHLVQLAADHLRNEDIIGRVGGEEFLILLPNTGLDAAATIAEHLRALVAARPVAGAQGPIPFTVSIGVTLIAGNESLEAVLQRADEAMYRAKANGRNRVELA